jgi:ABC-type Co2+ transport system permease subunit
LTLLKQKSLANSEKVNLFTSLSLASYLHVRTCSCTVKINLSQIDPNASTPRMMHMHLLQHIPNALAEAAVPHAI